MTKRIGEQFSEVKDGENKTGEQMVLEACGSGTFSLKMVPRNRNHTHSIGPNHAQYSR